MQSGRYITLSPILMRCYALSMAVLLMMLPLMSNSRSVIQLLDEQGAVPIPMAEEEEVKHACSITCFELHDPLDDHLLEGLRKPPMEDPYLAVEHFEVAVPPPKV
jgi:hypothetical protein